MDLLGLLFECFVEIVALIFALWFVYESVVNKPREVKKDAFSKSADNNHQGN